MSSTVPLVCDRIRDWMIWDDYYISLIKFRSCVLSFALLQRWGNLYPCWKIHLGIPEIFLTNQQGSYKTDQSDSLEKSIAHRHRSCVQPVCVWGNPSHLSQLDILDCKTDKESSYCLALLTVKVTGGCQLLR